MVRQAQCHRVRSASLPKGERHRRQKSSISSGFTKVIKRSTAVSRITAKTCQLFTETAHQHRPHDIVQLRYAPDTMARSLSSLWLKNIRRIGKAQQAQGRKLFKSLLPKAAAPAVRRAKSVKATRPKAAKPVRKPTVSGLPGFWQKSYFSVPAAGQFAPARRMLYWLYLPAGASLAPRPLVVMLHGCQQTATDFAAATRMNELAERKGFAVLYPQQSTTTDSHRCWHWYKRATQEGLGDVKLIADMIVHVQNRHGLDTTRTYAAGLSAGAGLANILALRYPDLIAAVGLHSAPVFGTTDSPMSAYRAMQHGASHAHIDAAQSLLRSQPQFPGMPAIVLHGDRDTVVR